MWRFYWDFTFTGVNCKLQVETNKAEYEKTESERHKREMNVLGVMLSGADHVPACEKIDQIFGSGGETIIHYMCFEQGKRLFEKMLQNSPEKTKEELVRLLVDAQPQAGWGTVKTTIIHPNPPTVEIIVKNPPVKTVKGSPKRLIGSFWAGVFSKYFDRQLAPKNFAYNSEKDEFSCVITI